MRVQTSRLRLARATCVTVASVQRRWGVAHAPDKDDGKRSPSGNSAGLDSLIAELQGLDTKGITTRKYCSKGGGASQAPASIFGVKFVDTPLLQRVVTAKGDGNNESSGAVAEVRVHTCEVCSKPFQHEAALVAHTQYRHRTNAPNAVPPTAADPAATAAIASDSDSQPAQPQAPASLGASVGPGVEAGVRTAPTRRHLREDIYVARNKRRALQQRLASLQRGTAQCEARRAALLATNVPGVALERPSPLRPPDADPPQGVLITPMKVLPPACDPAERQVVGSCNHVWLLGRVVPGSVVAGGCIGDQRHIPTTLFSLRTYGYNVQTENAFLYKNVWRVRLLGAFAGTANLSDNALLRVTGVLGDHKVFAPETATWHSNALVDVSAPQGSLAYVGAAVAADSHSSSQP
jgi:hypothetical protein